VSSSRRNSASGSSAGSVLTGRHASQGYTPADATGPSPRSAGPLAGGGGAGGRSAGLLDRRHAAERRTRRTCAGTAPAWSVTQVR
jgi:hypothetical protein